MKKIIALVLALTMVFAIVACGTPAEKPANGAAAFKLGVSAATTAESSTAAAADKDGSVQMYTDFGAAVIGADGFGFLPKPDGTFDKIPQLGNVIIEDDVEIGANTCIDRAKTDSTIIRKGVKLDNLIQIGHNVEVGENTVSSAQTGIAGTTKIGHNCFIGGQVGFADHIKVGNYVKIGSQSGLDKDVPDGEIRFGSPALAGISFHRSWAVFKELPELRRRVVALEKELQK